MFSTLLLVSNLALAAVPQHHEVKTILNENPTARLSSLKSMSQSQRIESLSALAKNKQASIRTRWRAITSLAMIDKKKSIPVVEGALSSGHWYLRNAGMVAIVHADRERAKQWAMHLLKDPALVVRTAAVQALKKLNAVESKESLWQELYSAKNFKKGKSLWVRRHIVEALSRFENPGSEKRFLKVLKDQDESLYPAAIQGLERVTGKSMQGNVNSQRVAWIKAIR